MRIPFAKSKLAVVVLLACLAPPSLAQLPEPGSVLVMPSVHSEDAIVTWYTITNSHPTDTTSVKVEFLRVLEEFQTCQIVSYFVNLGPRDNESRLTRCIVGDGRGYLMVSAQDPSLFDTPWSFNHLAGSSAVVTFLGVAYSFPGIPLKSPQNTGDPTDLDLDDKLDFDDNEYGLLPNMLLVDSAHAILRSSVALVSLSGGPQYLTTVTFDVFNDASFPFTAQLRIRCWGERRLEDISAFFDPAFLAQVLPNDPDEVDIDCDGSGDFESTWFRIRGLNAASSEQVINHPALLGAVTGTGVDNVFSGGKSMWGIGANPNGQFISFGSFDPEF